MYKAISIPVAYDDYLEKAINAIKLNNYQNEVISKSKYPEQMRLLLTEGIITRNTSEIICDDLEEEIVNFLGKEYLFKTGHFFAIEGADFTGKSAILKIVQERIDKDLVDKFIFTKEPGSPLVKSNKMIRDILLDREVKIPNQARINLYKTDRDIHWFNIIRPYINSGFNVFTDRTFISTILYQNSLKYESYEREYADALDIVFILYSSNIDILIERSKERILDGQESIIIDQIEEINNRYMNYDKDDDYIQSVIKFDISKYINNNEKLADEIISYIKEIL